MTQRLINDSKTLRLNDSMTTLRLRLIFSILSVVYIAMIFLWADSPMVSRISPYNPYSLLHIPLYGILAVLLTFSFIPICLIRLKPDNPIGPADLPTNLMPGSLRDPMTELKQIRLLIPGGIALVVAIADEFHQSFIPSRDASIADIFLDFVGIVLALFIIYHRYKSEVSRLNDSKSVKRVLGSGPNDSKTLRLKDSKTL